MGSLFIDDVVSEALSHVGEVCGKTNEFSAELDSVGYFNGPKNGVANSCSIYLHDMTYRSTRNASLEIDPDKWDSYYFLFCPSNPASNCGAGCTQQAGYFASGNSLYHSTQDAAVGDWCFFSHDGGETYYHVGLVTDWGYNEDEGCDGIWTVEGNTNGGYVGTHFYSYGKCAELSCAFGRPRYDGRTCPTGEKEPEPQKEDPKPTPIPEPEPTPEPEPSVRLFRVMTNSGSPLRLRAAPNIDSACLDLIPNGTVVAVSKIVDGEMINWNEEWAYTTYNGFTGYASCAYLVEE